MADPLSFDLIIIGAGPGGYEAALHAAKGGLRVAIVEERYLGGTCLNVGCIPTKTLLSSARRYEEIQHAENYGIHVGRPVFDLPAVIRRKNRVVEQLKKGVAGLLRSGKITLLEGHGSVEGRGRVRVGAELHECSNILIATGSRPARPPIPGIDGPQVYDSTGILDLEKCPHTLVIVGGGVIGVEFASFFASIGVEVHVIEMLERICPGVDAEIAALLQRDLKRQGVTFHLGARVESLEGGAVRFQLAGEQKTLKSDVVLVAIGRSPNLENLGLEKSGVEFGRKGIAVDEYGKTHVSGIWACGDVTGRCMLAHAAVREGQVVVNNILGRKDRMRYDSMPSVIYSHPEVACVGLSEDEARARGIAVRTVKKPLALAGRFLVEHEGQTGTCKVVLDETHGQILGVHMIGGSCSEMIWGSAALIENELRPAEAAQLIFPHPTVSEVIKEAISHHAHA